MTLTAYRYVLTTTSWDWDEKEKGGIANVVEAAESHHRTKQAALKAWRRKKAEVETWCDEDEHFIALLYYLDAETGRTTFFHEDDYTTCPPEKIGECELCKQRERVCYGRYADGRCKRVAHLAKGPWRVYALVDPRDGRTRYIGSTEKPLHKRLNGHMGNRYGKRGAWIDELATQGLKPTIQEIAQYETWLDALTHEYRLINSMDDLTNGQDKHRAVGEIL